MKTKEQIYNELYNSGLVDAIKNLFNYRNDISEDYYVLMADYIDSMDKIKDEMLIDPIEIAQKMPELVRSIQDTSLGGIHGITDDNRIQMEQSLSYEDKKLYFFHELTHALQTTHRNGRELCGFYDGHDGMFLTEGATQYIAETLYNVSNGTKLENRQQPRTVRGASDRTPYSPLSEYQYNGDILELLAKSMDLPLIQVLSLAYKPDGRETLKDIYESMDGNQGKFNELMNNLEQIYSIDNLLIHGYGQQLQSQTPLNITMQDRETKFRGNLTTYKELMNKVEKEIVATYIENHDTDYILQNYNDIANLLTTPEIKNAFLEAVQILGQEISEDTPESNRSENHGENTQLHTQPKMPDGYSISEFGEIIRPNREEIQQNQFDRTNKLSLRQRIAHFLQRNNLFMNLSFVNKFVQQQLSVLPPSTQTENVNTSVENKRENFMNYISNNGEYNEMPPAYRMSNNKKIKRMENEMKKEMNNNLKSNEDNGER